MQRSNESRHLAGIPMQCFTARFGGLKWVWAFPSACKFFIRETRISKAVGELKCNGRTNPALWRAFRCSDFQHGLVT